MTGQTIAVDGGQSRRRGANYLVMLEAMGVDPFEGFTDQG